MDATPHPDRRPRHPDGPLSAAGHPVSPDRLRSDDLTRARRALSRWLRRHGTPREDAEDAIQDAFVRLCRTNCEKPVLNPTGFLMAAVKRIWIDRWRSTRRDRRLFVAEPAEAFEIADPAPEPSDAAEADQRLDRLRWKLEVLSPRTREVFTRHRLEGRTYTEIAAALDISVSAVEKHIARAAFALAAESAEDD